MSSFYTGALYLTWQTRAGTDISVCKATALLPDSKATAVSVTTATELLGGSKFLLGFFPLRFFSISLEASFQKGMKVTM